MKTNDLFKMCLVALLMTISSIIMDALLVQIRPFNFYLWLVISNLLVTFVLGYFILKSTYSGWKLSLIVFIVYYSIGYFNTLIEALIFKVSDSLETINFMFRGLILAFFSSTLLVFFLNKWKGQGNTKPEFAKRSYLNWTWRILLGDFMYLIFYLAAGITLQVAYPEFMTFYEGKIPSMELIVKTQLFLRGFIYVGIAIVILKTSDLSSLKRAILTGSIFSILGGIAPLLVPNDLMPAYVRLGHGFEVGISNFLYGLLLGYLIGPKLKREEFTASTKTMEA